MPGVADITGNCVSVVYEDGSFQTEKWTDLDLLDTTKLVLDVKIFEDRYFVPAEPSRSSDFNKNNAGGEIVSVRRMPGSPVKLLVRCTQDTPPDNNQTVYTDGVGSVFGELPVTLRYASHISADCAFFMTGTTEEIEAAVARTDVGPCPVP